MLSCKRLMAITLILVSSSVTPVFAQSGKVRLRYHFEPGSSLTYKLNHELTIENVVGGNKQEYTSKSESTRVYRVLEVSRESALLELTVTHLKVDATLPSGNRIQVDSATDASHPLAKLAGKPIVRFRVTTTGEITDVQRMQPDVQGIDATLQYSFVRLPEVAVGVGDTWRARLDFTLPPPLGAGRTVPLLQQYKITDIAGHQVTIELRTALEGGDEVPASTEAAVAQFLMEGPVLFNIAQGHLQRSDFVVDRIVKGHAGEDSAMTVRGRLTQVLLDDVARNP